MKSPLHPALLFLFPLGTAIAQDEHILDDPALYELLIDRPDDRFPAGKPFPNLRLECLFYANAIVDEVLADRHGTPEILLTSVPTSFAGYDLFPNILHRDSAGVWWRTPVPAGGDGWTHVHRSTDTPHVILAMDNIPESAGWETRFVLSDDSGRTWYYGASIRKYVYFDTIRYFTMDASGVGAAVEHYVGDVGGYERIGYYVYQTHDWGNTWSDPTYRRSFDTTGFEDVDASRQSRQNSRRPLREIDLPGYAGCSQAAIPRSSSRGPLFE